jgi:hypothetical protein
VKAIKVGGQFVTHDIIMAIEKWVAAPRTLKSDFA